MGGFRAWQGLAVKGLPVQGFEYLPRDQGPAGILTAVLGLEDGLYHYYSDLARASSGPLAETLTSLAKLEEGHRRRIHRRLLELDPAAAGPEETAARAAVPAVEGGLTLAEFAELYRPLMAEPDQAVETAMMFEAQALDLYSRFGRSLEPGPTREMMLELAAEEKDHLKILGRLLEGLG